MERNRLEKEFNRKLSEREIGPSANAWDRLDAMLTVAENKEPKRNPGWLYIAAAIGGFIAISAVLIFNTQDAVDSPVRQIVVRENNQPVQDSVISIMPIAPASDAVAEKSSKRVSIIAQGQQPNWRSNQSKSINQPGKINQSGESYPKSNPLQNAVVQSTTAHSEKSPEIIPERNQEIALGSPELKQGKTIKVNANSLLSEVDGEVNISFREKVIKTYQQAKVAIVNRNNE